ncbi:hypothetical protein Avbf_10126 [Armadillidium vulgare]|nr:hypothetical protein Avbf_10126 [Armadillidium vulgare]
MTSFIEPPLVVRCVLLLSVSLESHPFITPAMFCECVSYLFIVIIQKFYFILEHKLPFHEKHPPLHFYFSCTSLLHCLITDLFSLKLFHSEKQLNMNEVDLKDSLKIGCTRHIVLDYLAPLLSRSPPVSYILYIEGMLLCNVKTEVRRLESVSPPSKRTKSHSLVPMSRYTLRFLFNTDLCRRKTKVQITVIIFSTFTPLHILATGDGIIEEYALICYENVGDDDDNDDDDDDDYSQYENVAKYLYKAAIAISTIFLFILVLAYIFTPHKLDLQKRCTFACGGNYFLGCLILFIIATVSEYVGVDDGLKCQILAILLQYFFLSFIFG